jgi:phosphodiesterase/alkaline phosphatase D-like protein
MAAAGGTIAISACAPRPAAPGIPGFSHGVASGDPHPDSVVIWTRLDPVGRSAPTTVTWQVTADERGDAVVTQGVATTGGDRDWTINVVADGLRPSSTYWYRFTDDAGNRSPVGRTRTAPVGGVDRLRFAVASCSNYAFGNFHAYGHMAARDDLDAWIHLGDYIYEYANPGSGETYGEYRLLDPSTEIRSLADYRRRYAHYRSDPDLQELHRRSPMIHVWDDHEFADDPFVGGASNHQAEDGNWTLRVAAALQAYSEWMPTRLDGNRIFRTLRYGDLATIVGVDRQRRFLWPEADDGDLYLGREQFAWLDGQLGSVTSDWTVLMQQTTFGATSPNRRSGGWGERDRGRVLTSLGASGSDLLVLTGDIHRFHAIDVLSDPSGYDRSTGRGVAAVEFAAGSVTSPGSNGSDFGPQVRWTSGDQRGYAVIDLTPERSQCDFFGFPDPEKLLARRPAERWLGGFTSRRGAPGLVQAGTPAIR